jgi:hypothetical protein
MHWRNYQTRYEAQQNILDYISMFYNNYCLLSTVGYVSSNDYERLLTEIKEAS